MSETDPAFVQRFAALGAGLPPEAAAAVAPATPTEVMTVAGVQLAVSDRLTALAKIRDQHRAVGRASNERRHDLRDRSDDLTRRIRLIEQGRFAGTMSATAEAEVRQLQADLEQIRSAQRSLDAEAEASTAAFGDADRLLRAALQFAKDHGAVIPVTISQEVR